MDMETKLTDLEKKLIALSSLGICIQHADGHRWIVCLDEWQDVHNNSSFSELHDFNSKVYGSVYAAIQYIDYILSRDNKTSLLEIYNEIIKYSNYGSEHMIILEPVSEEYLKNRQL